MNRVSKLTLATVLGMALSACSTAPRAPLETQAMAAGPPPAAVDSVTVDSATVDSATANVPTVDAPTVDAPTVDVVLEFSGLVSTDGQLVCALWADRAAFEADGPPLLSARLPILDSTVRWTVEVPVGAYAVKAFHDLDGDGELGRGSFGQPLEPYGVSNDARGRFGPPTWDAARFEIDPAGSFLSITVR